MLFCDCFIVKVKFLLLYLMCMCAHASSQKLVIALEVRGRKKKTFRDHVGTGDWTHVV